MHVGATLARFLAPVTTFVVVLPIAACTGDQNLQLPIIEDGTEVVTVELAAAQNPRVLQIDVDVGGITGFGHVADVTGTGDGGFGVLDRMEKAISVYGPSGRLERRIGRSGEGPGEFSDPIAVVWTGLYWVVWDRDPNKTFTIFDTAGTVTSTIRRPVDGDWRANIFRAGPALREYPYQTTSEDLTHRLRAAGDSHFVHIIQIDEQQAYREGDTAKITMPPAFILRYTGIGNDIDTVMVLAGTPSYLNGLSDYWGAYFEQPIFAARPRWSGSDRWMVDAHGDSGYIRAWKHGDSQPQLRIRVAESRRTLDEDDQRTWGEWVHGYALMQTKDKEWIMRQGQHEYISRTLPLFRFAQYAPTVHNVFLVGDCLWIQNFDPASEVSGGGLIFVVVSLVARRTIDVVSLEGRGHRVHDIDETALYSSYHDSRGLFHVARWPHSIGSCDEK